MKTVFDAIIVSALCFTFLIIPALSIWYWISADGKVTACYIREVGTVNHKEDRFVLKGHIEWRDDEHIGWFKSQDEARAEAAKINCPIIP